jgi:hypothetical protein
LSAETGMRPPPGGYVFIEHPYADYWKSGDIWFPYSGEGDTRLRAMRRVFGVLVPGASKAYPTGKSYVANDVLADHPIVVWHDSDFNTTAAFEAVHGGQRLTFEFLGRESHGIALYSDAETGSVWTFDGIAVSGALQGARLARVVGIRVFWFAWTSFYPETAIFTSQ